MTDRLNKNLNRLAEEAGIKELTPEIRRFAWLINRDYPTIGFWEVAHPKPQGEHMSREEEIEWLKKYEAYIAQWSYIREGHKTLPPYLKLDCAYCMKSWVESGVIEEKYR
jgi:hypothetical protein